MDTRRLRSMSGSARCCLLPRWMFGALLGMALLGWSIVPAGAASAPLVEADGTGFDFLHWNGMAGELYFVEMMGPGGALFDLEGDGDLDLYVVQGAKLSAKPPLKPWTGASPPRDHLYRNDLKVVDGRPVLKFTEVGAKALPTTAAKGYGMGVAVGDVDNDGYSDLYVYNLGSNQLLRNRGDGTFEDRTAASSTDDDRWTTSATFFDYDRDGWLDLLVVNYVRFDVANNVTCYAPSSRRDYCGPGAFPAQGDRLLRNRGDGTFEDRTAAAGMGRTALPGLGAQVADYDGDGWPDVFIANDGEVNSLWLNRGDGTFSDEALLFGVAVNRQGRPEASMGVATADFDSDGDEDLFITHLLSESNTFYVSAGGFFEDRTRELGLASPSLAFTSFGTGFVDLENDGWLDLLVVNGAVKVVEGQARSGDVLPLAQSNQLFRNRPGRTPGARLFVDASGTSGNALDRKEVSRGAAFGDLDNDGDSDVLVFNNNAPSRLLLNAIGQDQPWVGLELLTGKPARPALGAKVVLRRRGAPDLWRRVSNDGSFASASDSRVLFGLSEGKTIDKVEVTWPDGSHEVWDPPTLGRYSRWTQGEGRAVEKAASAAQTAATQAAKDGETKP